MITARASLAEALAVSIIFL